MEIIRVSVRSLVEFILRSGDIDNRRGSMADKEAMQMGSRLHRKIQGQMGASYHAEIPLKTEVDCKEYILQVEGRADGIFTEDEQIVIDEIKGVYRDVNRMEEAVPVHLAQAKCYAYIYGKEQKLSKIDVQMTYANLDTEEIRRFRVTCLMKELEKWFVQLVEAYRKWTDFQIQWKKKRQASIGNVEFPYPYREGQRDLAAAVYRTIEREKKLFIQAPTGVGKTLSTVFPAVKAVGEGLGEKIFYLTAKTITRTVAQEAFSLLKKQGLCYKVITLTAKEKICLCEEPDCNPEKCPYAKGHYDRINDAVFELLTGRTKESEEEIAVSAVQDSYTREDLIAHAKKWMVCPFEMGLDVSLWVDGIICDYNYVFDPQAKLKRFFADGVKGDYIFLIDEAHNLVERGREMFSALLYKEDFLEVKRLLKPISKRAERALEKCNRYMLAWKRECSNYMLLRDISPFSLALMNVSSQLEKLLEDREGPLSHQPEELRKKVLEFYFQVRSFLEIYENLDDSYEIYTELEGDGRFKIKLYCIDTSEQIRQCLEKGRGTVLFSATLLPVRYYMGLLSGTESDYAVYAHSPFDPKRKKVLIGRDVSSRYTRRNQAEYERIAQYIRKAVEVQPGNYLVFLPSYKMLEDVQSVFEESAEAFNIHIVTQSGRMTEKDRETFLEHFSEHREESVVGFCVMGGIFGEGIDLKGNRLIGALVVGTGLPQICNEREILKQYYDKRGMDGFSYAYQYPGMNKVMQSAGRVIRTDEDRGVILLLDERFCQAQYRNTFPREWSDFEICTLRDTEEKLRKFWEEE